jgi:hypothetical protein
MMNRNAQRCAVMAWQGCGGPKVTPERIADHWETISKWLNQKPKTIRHMSAEELRALREEIIAALLAAPLAPQGSRQRILREV